MRLVFGLIFAALVFFVLRNKIHQFYRRLRGLPEPERSGPKTVNIVLVTFIIIYATLLGYRLFIGEPIMY